ncbi:hypothetical protein BPS13_0198 [Bacillus phage BPS13]|uniref:Uncharacterized protein n=1 Tax=Bacillus phage BPS13 TaxID=1136731 RepID=J9PUA6_9CAUD|nr:hypothetical protein BPS13_0198 [Bacillus phage BPS13]AEZ50377.1 hypothetical protein BPS13_0198 [Bacillus phage BPS13]
MVKTYKIIILLNDGTEITDSCPLIDKDMREYVEARFNPFKGMLIGKRFAISKDTIKMMFFEDEAITKEEK